MRISFFTKPLALFERFAKDCERRFNYLKYTLRGNAYKAWTCSHTLGGHQDLVDSFIKGAQYFPDVELFVNPRYEDARGSIAYVPCSWRVLRDVIAMKRRGMVEKLIAGPMICHEGPSEHEWIIADDAIDCYLLASRWVADAYLSECRVAGRLLKNLNVWAAGVDEKIWSPLDMKEGGAAHSALLYVKGEGAEMSIQAAQIMKELGIETKMLRYGSYVPEDYKRLLEWCNFVVVMGGSETQGLSLTQAWSMNRPTLVYESESVIARGRDAAPYITPQTGMKWHNVEELREGLAALRNCTPRRWVLENQTNEAAFRQFLSIVKTL